MNYRLYFVGILLLAGRTTLASPTCVPQQMQLDVVLMLDSSRRVDEGDFRKLTAYLGNLFSAFNISPSGTRVAICGNFGNNNPIAYVNWKESSDISHLRSVLNGLPYFGGNKYDITGNSYWSWGLTTLANRPDATDVLIIFSASSLDGGYDPVYPFKDFRVAGGRVITVALGGLAADELAPLASDDRYATAIADYDHFGSHTDFLVNAMCDARCWAHATTELTAPSGTFHSALYPQNYCNNLMSHHHIISPAPMRVQMRMPDFHLAQRDHADVHSGLYLGEIKANYFGSRQVDFRSGWNEMDLHFHADESSTAEGFSGAYRACIPGLFAVCAPFVAAKNNQTMGSRNDAPAVVTANRQTERLFDKLVAQSLERPANRVPVETKQTAETTGAYCDPKVNSYDIVIMLDAMADMRQNDFNGIVNFLRFTFLPQFVISHGANPSTRVGIAIPFADLHDHLAYLTLPAGADLLTVQNALRDVPYLGRGNYEFGADAILAWGMFTPPSHNRPTATDVILLFTAIRRQGFDPGYGFGDFTKQGGRVIAVGVGANVAASDLADVATGPHAFHVDSGADLSGINVDLLNAFCDDFCYPTANQMLTAPTATFSTPFFPSDYCNNLDANYLISLQAPLTVDARIPRLQSERCCDFLRIFGGANLAEQHGSFSGDKRNIHHRSPSGNMYLHFTSDEGTPAAGFEVNYKACIPGLFGTCAA